MGPWLRGAIALLAGSIAVSLAPIPSLAKGRAAEPIPVGSRVPDQAVVDRVRGSTIVFVYRLDSRPGQGANCPASGADPPGCISGFSIAATHSTPTTLWRNTMKGLLADPASYSGGGARCGFTPDVGVRFTRAGSTTNVLLDFHCLQILVWSKGTLVSYGSFEPRFAPFFRLAIQSFPDDLKLRQLYEQHRRRLTPPAARPRPRA